MIGGLGQGVLHERPWFYFDAEFYGVQCGEAGVSPPLGEPDAFLAHYLRRGARFGLSPNPLFNELYYRRLYPDVAREIQTGRWSCAFEQYVAHGAAKGQSPNWFFDGGFYRTTNVDLTDDGLQGGGFADSFTHYLLVGLKEHRTGHWIVGGLSAVKGLEIFPASQVDLAALLSARSADLPAQLSPLFSYDWMREKYDWGRTVQPRDFIVRYVLDVAEQKLSPSAYFDEAFYLSGQPEVARAVESRGFTSGYEHFLLYGMHEWRRPFAAFDPLYYAKTNLSDVNDGQTSLRPAGFVHFLRNRGLRRLRIAPPLSTAEIAEDAGKAIYERRCRLNAPHVSGLVFAASNVVPDVSIIIAARDNFEQTANCIVSACYNTKASLEVIVFDNGSTDEIALLPQINPAIVYLRAGTNTGFTLAVNNGAAMARGRTVLLLNNDIEVAPGAIDFALETLHSDPAIGAVGGKIVRMHGLLQEAGSVIWQDGSCLGYARDGDPGEGQVSFRRDVDYCSGCFLLLRRDDWDALGGFDEAFAPAYYEETDLCVRIWNRRQRVVYDPRVLVWHFEFSSSAVPEEALTQMRRNKRLFASKHPAFLSRCLPPNVQNIERARLRHCPGARVLFIEDKVPDPRVGMGFVRSAGIIGVLEAQCGLVSVVGLHTTSWPAPSADEARSARVEIVSSVNITKMEEFLQARVGVYDVLWLSRTHNLEHLRRWRTACPEFFEKIRIVLDTEAISAVRKHAYLALTGQPADLDSLVGRELEHLDGIDHICTVSAHDQAIVERHLEHTARSISVSILGHALPVQGEMPDFSRTQDIVLVGSFAEPDSPNADALLWFDRAVRPLLPELPGLRFVIAGSHAARLVGRSDLRHSYHVINNPQRMDEVYRSARLMLAPTRFAAGVPMKVHEAAAAGVPVVMTEILGRQLGWTDAALGIVPADAAAFADRVVHLATDREAWLRARDVQLGHVSVECDVARFASEIRETVGSKQSFFEKKDQKTFAALAF